MERLLSWVYAKIIHLSIPREIQKYKDEIGMKDIYDKTAFDYLYKTGNMNNEIINELKREIYLHYHKFN